MSLYLIGCDIGGLFGKNDGLAVVRWDGKRLREGRSLEGGLFSPLAAGLLDDVAGEVVENGARAVIGIDGNLGWPVDFQALAADPKGPDSRAMARQQRAARAIDSPFLYRETERFVKLAAGRTPLTGVGDRFGSACCKAQLLVWQLVGLFQADGVPRVFRPPFDGHGPPLAQRLPVSIIEVYPKLAAQCPAFGRLAWPGQTEPVARQAKTHQNDARLAALMAACYARTVGLIDCDQFPPLAGPDQLTRPEYAGLSPEKVAREGWIYFPLP